MSVSTNRALCAVGFLLATIVLGPHIAADDEVDPHKQAAQERKNRYTKWMREYAEGTKIVVTKRATGEQQVELVANPVFRYSDEERFIPDATLWVWTRSSRPVAFQKVEGNNHGGGQMWTICFASLSENLLSVKWPVGREFQTRTPGVRFAPFSNSDAPADKVRARTLQIKALKDRFTGRLNVNAEGNGGAETRFMVKPLFEYADPDTKLPLGAIFGMTSTGTNPDLLLLIEARRDAEGKLRWEYAHARMTSASIRVRLDDVEVWSQPNMSPSSPGFENWLYYFMDRDFP
ncbi:MAG: hypothetical protein HY290_05825 [Planctomycetia bacterium]|nr:hypothetical protein [Planctomycetia bacterium]